MTHTDTVPQAIVSTSAVKRLQSGHRWIYANEFSSPVAQLPVGGVVRLVAPNSAFIGHAHTIPHSLIAGRLLNRDERIPDEAWLCEQLDRSKKFRDMIDAGSICRLVFAEGDLLPGLTIDRYENHFVIQIVTAGMERWKTTIIDWIQREFPVASILFRNDTPFRKLEALSEANEIAIGEPSERFVWNDRGVMYQADLLHGQKTGGYLDQRYNRYELDWISDGKRVLDLFCHHGGFGLRAALTGAEKVTFVDASETALAITAETAAMNRVVDRCEFIRADIFEWLQHHVSEYDIVICDPPALIKNRSTMAAGERAYRNLNHRAMNRVAPGGMLFSYSCSHLMDKIRFRESIRDAARGEPWIVVKEQTQAPDHPILLTHPETEYLCGLVLQKIA